MMCNVDARVLDMSYGEVLTVEIDGVIFVKERNELALPREEAKWAKIGREPGEFKKGDIVHDGSNDSVFTVVSDYEIEVGKVSFYSSDGTKRVNLNECKLIAPVESRFDKDSE